MVKQISVAIENDGELVIRIPREQVIDIAKQHIKREELGATVSDEDDVVGWVKVYIEEPSPEEQVTPVQSLVDEAIYDALRHGAEAFSYPEVWDGC